MAPINGISIVAFRRPGPRGQRLQLGDCRPAVFRVRFPLGNVAMWWRADGLLSGTEGRQAAVALKALRWQHNGHAD